MNSTALRDGARHLRAVQPRNDRTPPADRGRRLATLPRGGGEEVRVSLDEYEGRKFLSIRVWRDGYPDPKRGIAIRLHELPAFADGLAAAMDEAAKLARSTR